MIRRPATRGGLLPLLLLLAATAADAGDGRTVRVRTLDELRSAAAAARPGTTIEIAPGEYAGGLHLVGLRGAAGKPVVLGGADPKDPPRFVGGANGFHFTDPEHVELRDLAFSGQTGNGLNVDDGGTFETPARGVVLRRLRVTDVGPRGNRDGIKLSGVEDFRVEACTVETWGDGGSAIDMVGCRRGTIEGCTFRRQDEASACNGVQAKGGTRDVSIRKNRFENAGDRGVNVGGSTGLEYFRPPLAQWKGDRFEAKDVRVEGNTFVGGRTPVAFVGADGGVFRFNTVHLPGRWALRILQETRAEAFVPSRRGEFTDNVVVFRSDRWSEGGVNVGDGTDAASFRFARNVWYCEDAPGRTKDLVRLPSPEEKGVHGKDPRFVDAAKGDLGLRDGSPAAGAGPDALPD